MASCSQLGPAWLTVMCNADSGTARWAGGLKHMKRTAGVCPPVRGTRYAAGGGGGGFGGLGGGGFGGLGGSMGQPQFNSLDHLVGAGEQRRRNIEAEGPWRS